VNATASSHQGSRASSQSDAPARNGAAEQARDSDAQSKRSARIQQLDFVSRTSSSDGIDAESAATLIEAQSEAASTPDRLEADRVQKIQSFQSISQSILSQAGISQDQNQVNLYDTA
jgi:hypothetical protein